MLLNINFCSPQIVIKYYFYIKSDLDSELLNLHEFQLKNLKFKQKLR